MRLIARLHSGYESNRVNVAHTAEGSAATVTDAAMVKPSQATDARDPEPGTDITL